MTNLEPGKMAWIQQKDTDNECSNTEVQALRIGTFEHWNNWTMEESLKWNRLEQHEACDSSVWLG